MNWFWLYAALLTAGALFFVLPPLLRTRAKSRVEAERLNVTVYRDQLRELEADRAAGTLDEAQYQRARLELERRLLDDVDAREAPAPEARPRSRVPAMLMGLAVPVLAVGLYFVVGNPRALSPVALPTDPSKGVTREQVEAMVTKLAERMKQNPEDAQGWAMLGKSYAAMGRLDDAVAAYAKAEKRAPDNPHLLADYADTLAMQQGQNLQGAPEALIARALKIDPNHIKSLALAGTIAFEKNDYASATRHWEKLLGQLPPDSEIARGVQSSIAEARDLAAKAGGVPKSSGAAASGINGTVSLAPALAAKAAPGDTVFVFARAVEGSRMPLAIVRKKVSDLPAKFSLDDSMAMSPGTKLSGAPQVIVGARISKSGDAMPRPGDLQGVSQSVNNNAQNVTLVIDTEVQ